MDRPNHNDDPVNICIWLSGQNFPFCDDELGLIRNTLSKKYSGEPVSIQDRYELTILYWQVVGFMRK